MQELESLLIGKLNDRDLIWHYANVLELTLFQLLLVFVFDKIHLVAKSHCPEKLTDLGIAIVLRIGMLGQEDLLQICIGKPFRKLQLVWKIVQRHLIQILSLIIFLLAVG